MKTINWMMIAGVSALAVACASTEADDASGNDRTAQSLTDDPRVGEEVDRVCFVGSINGFGEYGRGEGLILTKSPREKFLATLFPGCSSADGAMRVGLVEKFGSCLSRGDELVVSNTLIDSGGPFDTQLCRVGTIYTYDEDAGEEDEGE